MSSYKIHRIVEYIKLQPDFPFCEEDVVENIDIVLHYFGIYKVLDEQEESLLISELQKLAIEDEFREIEQMAQPEVLR